MATNKPYGDNACVGAVKKEYKFRTPKRIVYKKR